MMTMMDDRQGTHWRGCERVHVECANQRLAELILEMRAYGRGHRVTRQFREILDKYDPEVLNRPTQRVIRCLACNWVLGTNTDCGPCIEERNRRKQHGQRK